MLASQKQLARYLTKLFSVLGPSGNPPGQGLLTSAPTAGASPTTSSLLDVDVLRIL